MILVESSSFVWLRRFDQPNELVGHQCALVRMTKECVRELEGDPRGYDVEMNFLEGYREDRR